VSSSFDAPEGAKKHAMATEWYGESATKMNEANNLGFMIWTMYH
jgi:hypothetical protein